MNVSYQKIKTFHIEMSEEEARALLDFLNVWMPCKEQPVNSDSKKHVETLQAGLAGLFNIEY